QADVAAELHDAPPVDVDVKEPPARARGGLCLPDRGGKGHLLAPGPEVDARRVDRVRPVPGQDVLVVAAVVPGVDRRVHLRRQGADEVEGRVRGGRIDRQAPGGVRDAGAKRPQERIEGGVRVFGLADGEADRVADLLQLWRGA